MTDYKKQGKKNRASGKAFELKVRADLESKGWIVFRNSNDVEFGKGSVLLDLTKQDMKNGIVGKALCNSAKFSQAKSKWNPFTRRPMMTQSGFPDFVCVRLVPKEKISGLIQYPTWHIQFVECKVNGTLSKTEKEKIEWIKCDLQIPVFVASKEKEGRTVVVKYEEMKGGKTINGNKK
jgi:hypothetical protein